MLEFDLVPAEAAGASKWVKLDRQFQEAYAGSCAIAHPSPLNRACTRTGKPSMVSNAEGSILSQKPWVPSIVNAPTKPFSHRACFTRSTTRARRRACALGFVSILSVFCATSALLAQPTPPPATVPAAISTPRQAHGHPCTLWDDQDVSAYNASLTTNAALKAAFAELKAWGDQCIAEPLKVPEHKLEADSTWTFPAFKRGYQDAAGKWNWEWHFNTALQQRTADVSNLGALYAITGDERYAAFARRILLALADAYGYSKGSAVPDPHGYDRFEAYGFDGGDAGMFLAKACHGYDLIYNLPSLSTEERNQIERDLIRPVAEHLKKLKFMYTNHGRWGMVCLYGVFIAGVTLHDQTLVDQALYGLEGSKTKVTGGFMDCFNSGCLRDGVVWGADTNLEEQMAAVCVLTTVAEVMWRRGVDLYGYQDRAMKRSYDAALEAAGTGEISKLIALPGIDAYPYAFRHYQEPRYLSVVAKLKPGFTLAISEHLPSLPTAAGTRE
jgi:hypothetical protein